MWDERTRRGRDRTARRFGQSAASKTPAPGTGRTGAKQSAAADGRPPPPRIWGCFFLLGSQRCSVSRGSFWNQGLRPAKMSLTPTHRPRLQVSVSNRSRHLARLLPGGRPADTCSGVSDGEVSPSRLRGQGWGPSPLSTCPQTPLKTPVRTLRGPGPSPFSVWIFRGDFGMSSWL